MTQRDSTRLTGEKPLWISHRGYKAHALENTREAFQAAVDRGFTCIETDLRISRDHRIVLVHDPDLRRLAGDPRRINEMTSAELAAVRLKPPKPPGDSEKTTGRGGQGLMFFDDFAAEFAKCRWVLDIKPERGKETIEALAGWSRTNGMVDEICRKAKILTWKASHEAMAASCFPGISLYARRLECWRAGLSVLLGHPEAGKINPGKTYALTRSFFGVPLFKTVIVKRFHEREARVIAFLPPDERSAKQAVDAGFDEILTNGVTLP